MRVASGAGSDDPDLVEALDAEAADRDAGTLKLEPCARGRRPALELDAGLALALSGELGRCVDLHLAGDRPAERWRE